MPAAPQPILIEAPLALPSREAGWHKPSRPESLRPCSFCRIPARLQGFSRWISSF
jgi:hypothetical protein